MNGGKWYLFFDEELLIAVILVVSEGGGVCQEVPITSRAIREVRRKKKRKRMLEYLMLMGCDEE
jgi:hypothetical protein